MCSKTKTFNITQSLGWDNSELTWVSPIPNVAFQGRAERSRVRERGHR